jgi:hypothetical protein
MLPKLIPTSPLFWGLVATVFFGFVIYKSP